MKTLQNIFTWLKNDYNIVCSDETIEFGHVCKTVFRGTKDNRAIVVKIGLTENAKNEVLMNQYGYDEMRTIGAEKYLPDPCTFLLYDSGSVPILVMADCGDNLYRSLQKSKNPQGLFNSLNSELSKLYHGTLHKDPANKARQALMNAFDVLEEQFQDHLKIYQPFVELESQFDELKQRLSQISPVNICFACWDFTPEDMFLTQEGLKIIDPPKFIGGIPLVDLACFVGVVRDVYKLPGAEYGYDKIRKLSLDVGTLLGLTEAEHIFLFDFGRALQTSLSSRHRIGKEDTLSKKYFDDAKNFLVQCIL